MTGELCILNRSGHKAVPWDTEVNDGPLDPAVANAEFDRLVAQGHMGFGTKDGESEQIRTFQPETYDKITVTPAFAGG